MGRDGDGTFRVNRTSPGPMRKAGAPALTRRPGGRRSAAALELTLPRSARLTRDGG